MFFFDKILQLFISDSPLLVSSKVIAAAQAINLELQWNDKGEVCAISYNDARALCEKLNIRMLSVSEMMHLAQRAPAVASSKFAEWLSDTYTLQGGKYFDSTEKETQFQPARPGWFDLSSVDQSGYPASLSQSSGSTRWKFWTPGHEHTTMAAIRSFVTSSGTCSLDLGIPAFARHPMIMIRECYEAKEDEPASLLDPIWSRYKELVTERNEADLKTFLSSLDWETLEQRRTQDDFVHSKELEMLADLKGKHRLYSGHFEDLTEIGIDDITRALSRTADKDATIVLGHRNPDADSIVSGVFEATRRSLIFPDTASLTWSESIPHEVAHILGSEISQLVAKAPFPGPSNNLVLVDCHSVDRKLRHQVKSIIDHHIVKRHFPYYAAISHDVSWSSTLQVYTKFLGSGLDLDQAAARMLLAATKLEAEPELLHNMTQLDKLTWSRLELKAGESASYVDLMRIMTDPQGSAAQRFYKDYKQSSYGFSVIKTCQPGSFKHLAEENNIKYCLPLTVIKEVLYDKTFSTISRESFTLVFNENFHDKGFKEAVRHALAFACETFHRQPFKSSGPDNFLLENIAKQTPRLLLMPLIEEIVQEHLKFVYSTSIKRYIACGFVSKKDALYGQPGQDADVRTRISYKQSKNLLKSSKNTSMLSLPEYWQVYHELESRRDRRSLESLQDKHHVELLDTFIKRGLDAEAWLVYNNESPGVQCHLPSAHPGLIRPASGSHSVGFPTDIESPDCYGDASLWRYWSPDSDENVATRGHIFIMAQTCIDLKIRPDDATERMTFRPVYRDIPDVKFSIERTDLTDDGVQDWVKITIHPRLFSINDGDR